MTRSKKKLKHSQDKDWSRDFPWWSSSKDSVFPMQGVWVWSLIGELRSHRLQDTAKKTKQNISSYPHDNSVRELLLSLFYRWGRWRGYMICSKPHRVAESAFSWFQFDSTGSSFHCLCGGWWWFKVVSDSYDRMDCSLPGSSVDSPGKNTGVGCHFFLQGIFPTQGTNLGLLHCRQILYHLSHHGSQSN